MEDNKRNIFKIILIVLLVVLIIGMAVIAYFYLDSQKDSEMEAAIKEKEAQHTMSLEEFVVNLKPNDNKRFLKANMSLMFEGKGKDKAEFLEANIDLIRDEVIAILREKTAEDFLEVENTKALKEEIVEKLNESLGARVIEDVYFTDLVVQ